MVNAAILYLTIPILGGFGRSIVGARGDRAHLTFVLILPTKSLFLRMVMILHLYCQALQRYGKHLQFF